MTQPLTVGDGERARVALAQARLDEMRSSQHASCLLCGKDNPIGLGLSFRVLRPGVVSTTLVCSRLFQSYPEMLHGGVISALLDSAMSNCLFSLGEICVIAECSVRYLRPAPLEKQLEVVGQVHKAAWPVFQMAGELRLDGAVLARAQAKFVDRAWASPAVK